jgi:hypothetical protein
MAMPPKANSKTRPIGEFTVVAPGFHAGRLWLALPPGMEAGRYNV